MIRDIQYNVPSVTLKEGHKKRAPEMVYVAAWVLSLNEEDSPGRAAWDPPEKMKQFGFLVGKWEGVGAVTSGHGDERAITAQWSAENILGGWAIQDHIRLFDSSGALLRRSTVLRAFSADRDQWEAVELSLPERRITTFQAHRIGDSMVMSGVWENGSDSRVIRTVYHDIYRDSFQIRINAMRIGDSNLDLEGSIRLELKRA